MSIDIKKLSKYNRTLLEAYRKGYRVVNGEVISPFSGQSLKLRIDSRGYYEFSVRVLNRYDRWETRRARVHRLVAFQKFGFAIFEDGIEVRHLNGDSTDNFEQNIAIGTPHQNQMDRPAEIRYDHSIVAATQHRKFDDDTVSEIRRLHNEGWTYRMLMAHYNITSKGTMSHIINHKYVTKV